MPPELLASLIGFSFAMSGTPGPNNLMVMTSGLNFGFRRTVPHLFGVGIGFAVMVLLVGLGLGQIFARFPLLFVAMKVAGALYLLWMAWGIAHAGPMGEGRETGRPFTFLEAAGFQWVNPKAWIVALGAISTYAQPASPLATALIISGVMGLIGLLCAIVWTGFGTVLRSLFTSARVVKAFNITMALLLLASLWPILADLVAR